MIDVFTLRQLTKEARNKMFLNAKEDLLKKLENAAKSGCYYLDYVFSENVDTKDVQNLKAELEKQGLFVEINYGLRDDFEIKWYESI